MNSPAPNENDSNANKAEKNSLEAGIDWNRRTGPIFKYGIATGFILILIGGISFGLSLTNSFLEILVICSGLSIILGAFGSTASLTIPWQGSVLVGVAGIALVLFNFLVREMDDRYVRVKIGGDVKGSQIDFVGDRNYLGAFQQSEHSFDFVIIGKEIRRLNLALYITLPDGTERPFECINRDELKPHLASGKTIEWSFDSREATLIDVGNRRRIAELGPCQEKTNQPSDIDPTKDKTTFSSIFNFISSALADSNVSISQDTKSLISQLESSATYARRDARTMLSKMGISVIKPLLFKLSEATLTYRSRLGVIVALTEMIRENKSYRKQIIESIMTEDLQRLIAAAADEDRTIRIYASEFLYDLGDPRSVDLAFNKFPSASENGRYNLLLVIKGALPFIAENQKEAVIKRVIAFKSENTPKTNELIDSIVTVGGR